LVAIFGRTFVGTLLQEVDCVIKRLDRLARVLDIMESSYNIPQNLLLMLWILTFPVSLQKRNI
jgi:hypothetical protein